jgi:peptidoglycan/xylan/chitin deacetylase (PgdA/CDA1 family)
LKKALLLLITLLLLGGCGSAENLQVEKAKNADDKNQQSNEDSRKPVSKSVNKQMEVPVENEPVVQASPEYVMEEDFSIRKITDQNQKVILLTIDDAPDKYALTMARTLKSLNVNAIFFVNGHFIDTAEEGEILKQIHQMGFSIGNHTLTHKSLKELTIEQQQQEIIGLNDRVEELIGERPRFFRAPFGVNTDFSRKIAAEEKMLVMNWTYGYDWEKSYQTKEALTDIMINTPLLKNGANLLMHDREWTSAALSDIVKGLQGKGYEIVNPDLIQTPGN